MFVSLRLRQTDHCDICTVKVNSTNCSLYTAWILNQICIWQILRPCWHFKVFVTFFWPFLSSYLWCDSMHCNVDLLSLGCAVAIGVCLVFKCVCGRWFLSGGFPHECKNQGICIRTLNYGTVSGVSVDTWTLPVIGQLPFLLLYK